MTDKEVDEEGYFDPLPLMGKEQAADQWSWIESELKSSTADYILVVGHYPVNTSFSHSFRSCTHFFPTSILRFTPVADMVTPILLSSIYSLSSSSTMLITSLVMIIAWNMWWNLEFL
jgi:hypothetical protein